MGGVVWSWILAVVIFTDCSYGNHHVIDLMSNEDDSCAHQMSRVYRDDVTTPYPPDFQGEWSSIRCEVRSGPEYLLRKYRFLDGDRFSLYQFYYSDVHCRTPTYVLLARGSYRLEQASWLVEGAADLEYQLERVSLMAYSDPTAHSLLARVNRTCPGFPLKPWSRRRWYDVFNYMEVPDKDYPDDGYLLADRDCLHALGFSLHELQLVRQEVRTKHDHVTRYLYLGDVHTEVMERSAYRPTGFQDPLAPHDQSGCPVCSAVSKADEYNPPALQRHPPPPFQLRGSWFSRRCETRPNGVFLTRHLSFSDDNRTWDGYYHHFLDGLCQRPRFTVYVSGKYAYASTSDVIQDGHNVDFQVLRARVKPTDTHVLGLLNQAQAGDQPCGDVSKWQLDVEADVTVTRGCSALGISLPNTEFETVRLEQEHHQLLLYLGQRPTAGGLWTPSDRPTSFQAPLVRCSDHPRAVTPAQPFHVVTYPTSRSPATITLPALSCLLLSLILSHTCSSRYNEADTMD